MPPNKPLTHFLCLPVATQSATSQWQTSLQHFTADIQSRQTGKSPSSPTSSTSAYPTTADLIPVKAIRPLGTLHLTIGVMSLTKPEKVEAATQLLANLDLRSFLVRATEKHRPERGAKIAAAGPDGERSGSDLKSSDEESVEPNQPSSVPSLTITFTGLKSMHSPKSTSFLYIPPIDATGRLYPFCQALKDRFTQEGLMVEERRPLKLHATILNTIYAGKVYPSQHATQAERPEADSANVGPVSEGEHPEKEHAEDEEPEAAENNEVKTEGRDGERPAKKKGKRRKQAIKFDARDLLNRYSDMEWVRDIRIEKVAICEMGAKKTMDENGEVVREEYTEIASIPLP